uniref:Retinoic acid receptor responder 3 n=1 Tax=Eptatretus burgeri TaxID=7764 RepID=A0A8C4N8F9_EPTBU
MTGCMAFILSPTRSPQPGDLIEIFRPSGVYEHWAIYIGNGDVIHVAANGLGLASSSASFASAFGGTPTVKKEKLKIVVGDNSYQINNKYDHKYRPLPAKEIVEAALSRVGQKVDYDVFTNNCEHFVTLLRYGEPDSEQLFMSTDPGWRSLYRRNVGTIKKRRKTFLFTSWTHRKA